VNFITQKEGRNLELAFRSRLRQMRGNKTRKQFAEEIGMKESNYLKIELGKSNPTVKTLERIAKLTSNSTLVIDLIPNDSEQLELQLDSEISKKSKRNIFTLLIAYFFKSGILDITKQRTE
jgi:transcriptional regulator with XRE-family HTH domain